MPSTAFKHFKEDIARSKALVKHAQALPESNVDEKSLRSDVLRSAWMFTVGAADAYFCDAYSLVVGSTLVAKSRERQVKLPDSFLEIAVPISATLAEYSQRENWKWRVAARRMMDDRTVLSLGAISKLFNPFLPDKNKLFHQVVNGWVGAAKVPSRVFGILKSGSKVPQLGNSQDDHVKGLWRRFDDVIFQRRHDCIHNCDRPKIAIQALEKPGTVTHVIEDVVFLVSQIDAHIDTQFPKFLGKLGFPKAVIAAVTK